MRVEIILGDYAAKIIIRLRFLKYGGAAGIQHLKNSNRNNFGINRSLDRKQVEEEEEHI